METLRSPSRKPSRWTWAERILLLAGILCLGIPTWAYLDSRLYEMEQNERLEAALAASSGPPPPTREAQPPAAETDSFDSFREGAEQTGEETEEERASQGKPGKKREPPPLAAGEGELVGRIEIPRLGVSAIVLEGVGKRTLRRGAGHIPATARPEEPAGNVGIAAHRDSFFRGLKDIRKNDTIEVTTLDGTFRYKVEWTRIVQPEDTSVLAQSDDPVLTLVTCYPFHYVGSAPKRFIVRARRVGEEISLSRSPEADEPSALLD